MGHTLGLITKSQALFSNQINTRSKPPANKKKNFVKFNTSVQFVALFLSKLNGASHDNMKPQVKKQCKLLKKSKIIDYMNTRIIQSKENLKRLNKSAKFDERNRKASSKLMVVNILRLFRELYQNLISCRQVYKKENLSLIKSLLNAMNSVIWKRCKLNCGLFDYSKIIIYFDKLVFLDKNSSKNKRKKQIQGMLDNNVQVLIQLVNDYKELKAKNPEKPNNNKTINETVRFTPKITSQDYKLLI